jgi:hypothetical protein
MRSGLIHDYRRAHKRQRQLPSEDGWMAQVELLIAPLTPLPTFLLPRPLLTLWSLFLTLLPWRLLLTLDCPLLWLPPLILDCRASLLRRGLDWG